MNRYLLMVVYTMMLLPTVSAEDLISQTDTQQFYLSSNFTGDQLTVFYVSDVLSSARFYVQPVLIWIIITTMKSANTIRSGR